MPISLEAFAPRDERKPKTLHCTAPTGQKFPVEVEFYVNRITQEPITVDDATLPDGERVEDMSDTDIASWRAALSFCDVVASWDVLGPVCNRKGEIIVADGEPVPLQPAIVRLVPSWFTQAITEQLIDLAFPNRSGSRVSRRR